MLSVPCHLCVGQLSVPSVLCVHHLSVRRAEIPANINCCCYDCCGSLNVDMVVVWAVVDVFVGQRSVQPQLRRKDLKCGRQSLRLTRC